MTTPTVQETRHANMVMDCDPSASWHASAAALILSLAVLASVVVARSEERRVGKEC